MLSTNCPNCGAPLQFRSANLAAKVCDYCHSTIVRRGDQLENAGKAATVPDDVSPLQLGVRGHDGPRPFEIVGRVRWAYRDGAWNEWCALYGDGRYGWLSEASGRWMLLEEIGISDCSGDAVLAMWNGQPVTPGMPAKLGDFDFTVADVEQVGCVGAEGELPYPVPIGTTAVSVDLQRPDGRTASLQTEAGQLSAYTGRYVTLAEIGATGLREFDGWPMPRFAA
ncbi:DUF4178 domain-containing protein [Sphingomonas sp.]|uniref:DUF4178 domain-containing protein n=1 Tax=Sphingomonas sp. TaxID=28214 RepID=UPI003CC61825